MSADPIMAIVRKALDEGPQSIAAVAFRLRIKNEVIHDDESLAVAETCMAELDCRPMPKAGVKWHDILWATPKHINSANPNGEEAYAQKGRVNE